MVNGIAPGHARLFTPSRDEPDSDDELNGAYRPRGSLEADGNEFDDDDDEDDGEGGGKGEESASPSRNAAIAAKSNRKIADLEITNKSLLAINAILEAEKHRMQKEMRDLRRRLREQRLSLPPAAFRALVRHEQRSAAVSPSVSGGNPASTEIFPLAEGQINIFADDEDEEVGDGDEDEEAVLKQPDPAYERVTALVDALLFHAHDALARPAVLPTSPSAELGEKSAFSGKVLSPAEVAEHYERRRVKETATTDRLVESLFGDNFKIDPSRIPLPGGSELTDSSS